MCVSADAEVPWMWVAWTLGVAAAPGIGLRDFLLFRADAPLAGESLLLPREAPLLFVLPDGRPLPPWDPEDSTPSRVDLTAAPVPSVKTALFRRDAGEPVGAYTWIRISRYDVNEGGVLVKCSVHEEEWPVLRRLARGSPEPDRGSIEAAALGRLAELIRVERARFGGRSVTGQMDLPMPFGPRVPFGDVLLCLRAFRAAGIQDVRVVGCPLP
jgi:hypothetical protein